MTSCVAPSPGIMEKSPRIPTDFLIVELASMKAPGLKVFLRI